MAAQGQPTARAAAARPDSWPVPAVLTLEGAAGYGVPRQSRLGRERSAGPIGHGGTDRPLLFPGLSYSELASKRAIILATTDSCEGWAGRRAEGNFI